MSESRKSSSKNPRLRLVDFKSDGERPAIRVYAVDRSFGVIDSALVGEDGAFNLAASAFEKAHQIVIGPDTQSLGEVDREHLLVYRPEQFRDSIADRVLEIPSPIWQQWHFILHCVTGTVRRCYPYPWFIRDLTVQANTVHLPKQRITETRALTAKAAALDNIRIVKPILPPYFNCKTICNGTVEVYRRVCCCEPWIVYDPRLSDLIRRLKDIVLTVPKLPWPPIPGPDPAPFRELPFFKEGALDEVTLNAQQDLEAITTLEAHQVADYIQARPYLCHLVCGSPKKVAQGYINPDGKFSICWLDSLGFTTANCHSEYAYVVKQKFGNIWLTIYNGVTANKWYDYGDVANLISYHPLAQTCRVNDFPGEGAFVVLQDIGDAHSYRLKTPNADAWNSVASPAYNDGLADPVNNPSDALGQLKNRNWGGTLKLLYAFREEMRGIGARYYRISVREADSNGNPTGPRVYLSDGLSWKKFTGGGDVEAVTLGPTTVGGQSNLYTIPFDADADWLDNQYHGHLDTTQFDRGRHLLTLEVFDGSGRLMRPTGTLAPSGEPDLPTSVEAAFTFRRWYQEFGPTAVIPYAALTHMFWWDNRKAEAVIVDLRKNGSASEAECQFLEGDGSSTFSVGYRAYHEEPMFLLNHSLWWKRGLGGATRYLVDASPTNVGAPPSGVGVSPTHTFDYMLSEGTDEPLDKCSFALNLYVNVKTFNGEGTLDSLDDWDYASFALEISE